jgi:hypothetical protein
VRFKNQLSFFINQMIDHRYGMHLTFQVLNLIHFELLATTLKADALPHLLPIFHRLRSHAFLTPSQQAFWLPTLSFAAEALGIITLAFRFVVCSKFLFHFGSKF